MNTSWRTQDRGRPQERGRGRKRRGYPCCPYRNRHGRFDSTSGQPKSARLARKLRWRRVLRQPAGRLKYPPTGPGWSNNYARILGYPVDSMNQLSRKHKTEPPSAPGRPATIRWVGGLDGWAELLDQTVLPEEVRVERCQTAEAVWEAIRALKVRGAPAIGIAAAMGLVLAVRDSKDPAQLQEALRKGHAYLASARPTAVNLRWALDRMAGVAAKAGDGGVKGTLERLLAEAIAIRAEDAAMCRAIGDAGWKLVPDGGAVLTHCNAGGLATAEYGTALAVFYSAQEHGRRFEVFVDETRPLLQGARLTAWELTQAGLPATVICDSAAAQVIRAKHVRLIVTGADRIAANGDVANKIGTFGLALIARALGVPFYVAAPSSTFDLATPTGSEIPIEERSRDEIARFGLKNTVPQSAACLNLAFDVTPAELVRGIITERGIIEPVTASKIGDFFRDSPCNGPETG